ncbi:hypothetical protein LWC34_45020 [Kibdelosporangium philippinense]|uniref:Uncharacterized protein n=1 Tax=Kibdelosporangium philippinense TaxID=211113 RepID=A0ABS8ZQB0_9PSEU|nr:hypothetical protein [Kibdelosporangium philippinense]MCE7009921.1 hypothetical protein [Kibdelosporangium philippinense]
MTWVFGLRPWHRPKVGELVTCDQPNAVATARSILNEAGWADLAAQLLPRPPGARGASFNPNSCPSCHKQAVWHDLDGVTIRALHEGWVILARARIPIPQWRALLAERHGVYAF